jgi:type IV pilus assembly protein PilA
MTPSGERYVASVLKYLLQRAREARAAELGDGEGLEEGFTLIELMVVLLIIAILLAIAIPTFLGITGTANDRAAQSNLSNGLTEMKALYQNAATFGAPAALQTAATASAPEFSWVTATNATTGSCGQPVVANCISFTPTDVAAIDDAQGLVIATLSKSGVCWYVADLEATPVAAATITPDTGGTLPIGLPTGISTAGVFYAKKVAPITTQCNAWYAAATAGFKWGPSYSNPGVN